MGWYTGYVRPTWASSNGLGPPIAAAGTARAAKIAPQPTPAATTRANTRLGQDRRCLARFACARPAPELELACLWSWDLQLDISAFLFVLFGFVAFSSSV